MEPHRNKPSIQDTVGEIIGGVFVGQRIAANLFAEEAAAHRWVIRSTEDHSFAVRIGEVMGSRGRFQAMRMNGTHVAMKASLIEAARALL